MWRVRYSLGKLKFNLNYCLNMPKSYTFTIDDDKIASDFEAGMSDSGLDPDSLWKKEVSDFANAHRRKVADDAKPEVAAVAAEAVSTVSASVKLIK